MFYLASDPDVPAVMRWAVANNAGLEPVTKLPENGWLVVSRLAVLTPAQVGAVIETGVELVTCDGIDMRQCSGVGALMAAILRVVGGAVKDWSAGVPVSGAGERITAEELARVTGDRDRLAEQVIDLTVRVSEAGTVKQANETLRAAMLRAPDFAWGWHCNIAMAAVDCGATPEQGNKAAQVFMRALLDLRCIDHETVEDVRSPGNPADAPTSQEPPVAGPESVGGSGDNHGAIHLVPREGKSFSSKSGDPPVIYADVQRFIGDAPEGDPVRAKFVLGNNENGQPGWFHNEDAIIFPPCDRDGEFTADVTHIHYPPQPVSPAGVAAVQEAAEKSTPGTPPKKPLKPGLAAYNERRRQEKAAKLASA